MGKSDACTFKATGPTERASVWSTSAESLGSNSRPFKGITKRYSCRLIARIASLSKPRHASGWSNMESQSVGCGVARIPAVSIGNFDVSMNMPGGLKTVRPLLWERDSSCV